MFLNKI